MYKGTDKRMTANYPLQRLQRNSLPNLDIMHSHPLWSGSDPRRNTVNAMLHSMTPQALPNMSNHGDNAPLHRQTQTPQQQQATMDRFGADLSENALAKQKQRIKRGECPTCGRKTHKVSRIPFKSKPEPLTVYGEVVKGHCLICHPIEGYVMRPPGQAVSNMSGMPPRLPGAAGEGERTMTITIEDDMTVTSEITFDPSDFPDSNMLPLPSTSSGSRINGNNRQFASASQSHLLSPHFEPVMEEEPLNIGLVLEREMLALERERARKREMESKREREGEHGHNPPLGLILDNNTNGHSIPTGMSATPERNRGKTSFSSNPRSEVIHVAPSNSLRTRVHPTTDKDMNGGFKSSFNTATHRHISPGTNVINEDSPPRIRRSFPTITQENVQKEHERNNKHAINSVMSWENQPPLTSRDDMTASTTRSSDGERCNGDIHPHHSQSFIPNAGAIKTSMTIPIDDNASGYSSDGERIRRLRHGRVEKEKTLLNNNVSSSSPTRNSNSLAFGHSKSGTSGLSASALPEAISAQPETQAEINRFSIKRVESMGASSVSKSLVEQQSGSGPSTKTPNPDTSGTNNDSSSTTKHRKSAADSRRRNEPNRFSLKGLDVNGELQRKLNTQKSNSPTDAAFLKRKIKVEEETSQILDSREILRAAAAEANGEEMDMGHNPLLSSSGIRGDGGGEVSYNDDKTTQSLNRFRVKSSSFDGAERKYSPERLPQHLLQQQQEQQTYRDNVSPIQTWREFSKETQPSLPAKQIPTRNTQDSKYGETIEPQHGATADINSDDHNNVNIAHRDCAISRPAKSPQTDSSPDHSVFNGRNVDKQNCDNELAGKSCVEVAVDAHHQSNGYSRNGAPLNGYHSPSNEDLDNPSSQEGLRLGGNQNEITSSGSATSSVDKQAHFNDIESIKDSSIGNLQLATSVCESHDFDQTTAGSESNNIQREGGKSSPPSGEAESPKSLEFQSNDVRQADALPNGKKEASNKTGDKVNDMFANLSENFTMDEEATINTTITQRRSSAVEAVSAVETSGDTPSNTETQSTNVRKSSIKDIPVILRCVEMHPTAKCIERAFQTLFLLATEPGLDGAIARRDIIALDGLKLLRSSIWGHMKNGKVILSLLHTLWAVSKLGGAGPENTKIAMRKIKKSQVFEGLMFAMRENAKNSDIQEAGCDAICRLANSLPPDLLDFKSAVVLVSNVLWNIGLSTKAFSSGLLALCSLCQLSDANKYELVKGGSQFYGAISRALTSTPVNLEIRELGCRLFWCVTSDRNAVSTLSSEYFLAKTILDAVSDVPRNKSSAHFYEAACGTLANLALDPINHARMLSMKTVPILCDTIYFYEDAAEVQLSSCIALANLSSSKSLRSTIVDQGAIPALFSSIKFIPHSFDVVSEACRGLCGLCESSEEAKKAIVSDLQLVFAAFFRHQDSTDLQRTTSAILCRLSTDEKPRKSMINLSGTFDALVKIMTANPQNVTVQEAVCATLRNLSVEESIFPILLDRGFVRLVTQAMRTHKDSEELQGNSCYFLWSLGLFNLKAAEEICAQGGIDCIITAMKTITASAPVQHASCGALWTAIHGSDAHKDVAEAAGAIDAVIWSILIHPKNLAILENAVSVLASLSAAKKCTQKIAEASGINVVVETMNSNPSSLGLIHNGTLFIRNMALANPTYANEAVGGITTILESLKQHPNRTGLVEESCEALRCLVSQSQSCRHRLLDANGADVIEELLERNKYISSVTASANTLFAELFQ